MKVLIDGRSLQARFHLRDRVRLCTLISSIAELPPFEVSITSGGLLVESELDGVGVLVITTRPEPYEATEISSTREFVRSGGGLLLMANHGDHPEKGLRDFASHDASLAREFGITIDRSFFEHRTPQELCVLSGPQMNEAHPIIAGITSLRPIRSVVINNSTSAEMSIGEPLITFSDDMYDCQGNVPAERRCLALALDSSSSPLPDCRGRIVAVGDSGFIGSEGTVRPGPGLIDRGDNLAFVLNALLWLGRFDDLDLVQY